MVDAALGLGVQVGLVELVAQNHGVARGAEVAVGLVLLAVGDHDVELVERHVDLGQGALVAGGRVGVAVGVNTDETAGEALEAVVELDRVGTPVALRTDAPGGGVEALVVGVDDHDDLAGPRRLCDDGVLLEGAGELRLVGGADDLAAAVDVEEDLLDGAVDDRLGEAEATLLDDHEDGADDDRAGQRGAGRARRTAPGDRRRGAGLGRDRLRLARRVRLGQEDCEAGEAGDPGPGGHGVLLRVGVHETDEMDGWKGMYRILYTHFRPQSRKQRVLMCLAGVPAKTCCIL